MKKTAGEKKTQKRWYLEETREDAVFTQDWNGTKDPRLLPSPATNTNLCNPLTKQASHLLLSWVHMGCCVASTAVSPSVRSDRLPAMGSCSREASARDCHLSEERTSVQSTGLTCQHQACCAPVAGQTQVETGSHSRMGGRQKNCPKTSARGWVGLQNPGAPARTGQETFLCMVSAAGASYAAD